MTLFTSNCAKKNEYLWLLLAPVSFGSSIQASRCRQAEKAVHRRRCGYGPFCLRIGPQWTLRASPALRTCHVATCLRALWRLPKVKRSMLCTDRRWPLTPTTRARWRQLLPDLKCSAVLVRSRSFYVRLRLATRFRPRTVPKCGHSGDG